MSNPVRARNEIPKEYTWAVESVFSDSGAWNDAIDAVLTRLPALADFKGRLGENAETLAAWFSASEAVLADLGKIATYAHMRHDVDTTDAEATADHQRARSLSAKVLEAVAFAEPELLALGRSTIERLIESTPALTRYRHYVDDLYRREPHTRSAEVEALLAALSAPFASARGIHGTLVDADLTFRPATPSGRDASEAELAQGNIDELLADCDRELRRSAWQNYADAHLAFKNALADCLVTGVQQNVFKARARRYPSALAAALGANHIPLEVFDNLIAVFRKQLPVWHRYWRIRRKALGYDTLHPYDIKAPLTRVQPNVPFQQAVEWIAEGMRPLGREYVDILRRGVQHERWVDVYPNKGKRSGAYSTGVPGTHPFILMSYTDDLWSLSTLAHELGHSLHSYYTRKTQPYVYADYSIFIAEVASNFNQALVRAHLFEIQHDRDFQIALIEEAIANFHRYFFIMPTLARFELEIHERVERGEALSADLLIKLLADLFREGYGDEVEMDEERVGITWAEFPTHLYSNFYVYQYATGISGAHALAERVLSGQTGAADAYLDFLRAGYSVYPLEALEIAGVDLTSPGPVEQTFGVLADLVDRLERLTAEAPLHP